MFKATFINCNQQSKREENNYVNLCEQNLKQNTKGYKCLAKTKYRTLTELKVEIIYEAESHRANGDLEN